MKAGGKLGLIAALASFLVWETASAELTDFPDEWPALKPLHMVGSQCVFEPGEFKSKGFSNSTLSERFEHPIFEVQFYGLEKIGSPHNWFTISGSGEPGSISVEIHGPGGNVLASKQSAAERNCDNHMLQFQNSISGGSGESSHVSSQITTKVGLLVDGSLVVNVQQETEFRKFFFFKEKKTSSVWYRHHSMVE